MKIANQMINSFESNEIDLAIEISNKFLSLKNGETQHHVSAIGHCHIDIAWLWTYAETRRKIARSWSTQINLMDKYPNYKFIQSQCQLYQWAKEDYPELYQQVKEKVKTGQFIPQGGSWTEMDGNMPSGESFIRQFLHGQLFFEEEFNKTSEIFWLPDTFGYSGQLPQIIIGCEMEYFVTQKLSWNSVNKFPHSTFYWQGIDGTKVLTHFPPAETYNSRVTIEEVVKSSENAKEPLGESILLFGHGDGGGGPTFEQIERILKLKDVDGIPKVDIVDPIHFFEKIEKKSLPKWVGELYLELHRGTFTSQANTKKGNRKCEILLRDIEILLILTNSKYPKSELNRLWKLLLLFDSFFNL
jgi:alpha-mannosidase